MKKISTKLSILLITLLISLLLINFDAFSSRVTDFSFNGAVKSGEKNGAQVFKKNDGTVIYRYKDKDRAEFKDGTTIEKFKNGNRNVTYKDGSKVRVIPSEGLRIYISARGVERKISFKGKTPYGEDIKTYRRLIQKNPVELSLSYDPEKSDEIFQGDIKKFYNELYGALRRRIIKKRYESTKPLEVVLSYCRFCEMGYCYGKDSKIVVEFVQSGKVLTSFTMNSCFINDVKRKNAFIKTIIAGLK